MSVPCRLTTSHICMSSRQRAGCAIMCCHVYHSSGPRLPSEEGSGITTCPVAPDPASLLGKVSVLPCAPWLQTRLPVGEGSGAATSPTVLNPTFLLEKASTLSRVPQLQTRFPAEEGYRRMGSVSRVTSFYATYVCHNTYSYHGRRSDPQGGHN
jgi:hypothetical protein